MADFLEEKKREIAERMKQLRPALEEYEQLDNALRALGGSAPATRRAPAKRRSGGGTGRRGRPKGTGSRANQTLELVRAEPGITIPQLAEKMGIKQNYLYRVLPGLEQDGLVRKEGRGWHPQAAA
jgi:CRP-like cAMP-binding protein